VTLAESFGTHDWVELMLELALTVKHSVVSVVVVGSVTSGTPLVRDVNTARQQ
jgi:hypothetical protein